MISKFKIFEAKTKVKWYDKGKLVLDNTWKGEEKEEKIKYKCYYECPECGEEWDSVHFTRYYNEDCPECDEEDIEPYQTKKIYVTESVDIDPYNEEDWEDKSSKEHKFLNHYHCPECGYEWDDVWDAIPDDDCPECGLRHISPYQSEDIYESIDIDPYGEEDWNEKEFDAEKEAVKIYDLFWEEADYDYENEPEDLLDKTEYIINDMRIMYGDNYTDDQWDDIEDILKIDYLINL